MKKIILLLIFIFSIFLISCIDTKSNFGVLSNLYIEKTNGDKFQGEYVDFFRLDNRIFETDNAVTKVNSAAPVYNYYLIEIQNEEQVVLVFEIKKANDYSFYSIEINQEKYFKDEFDITEDSTYYYLRKSFNITETTVFHINNLKMSKGELVNNAANGSGHRYLKGFCVVLGKVLITKATKELDQTLNVRNDYLFSYPYKTLPIGCEKKDDLYLINTDDIVYGFKLLNEQYYLSVMTFKDMYIDSKTKKDELQNHSLLKTYTKLKEENNCIYFQKENVVITVKYLDNLEIIDYIFVEVMYEESIK